MKRIMIFIGLKVAEILAIVFIPYSLGYLLSKWRWFYEGLNLEGMPYWVIGFLSLWLGLAMIVGIAVLCYRGIKSNWKWAKKIAGKKRK